MSPAAYHRIVEPEFGSTFFVRLTSNLIAAAMIPLMLSLAFDVYIVTILIVQSVVPSATIAILVFVVFAGQVSGNVRYAVMSFGSFMGLGNSHYPLPWNAIKYDTANEGYITNVTEDQLKDAPEFSDASWTNRAWETRWHRHFKTKPYWEQGAAAQSHNPMKPPSSM